VKAPLFVFLERVKNSAGRKNVLPVRGMIPLEEITPVHAVEFFRLLKMCQFDVRNFSAARKQAKSGRGTIPFIESTCGQLAELFRFKKLFLISLRNNSVWQKYASLRCEIFFIHGKCVGENVKVFALSENVLGGS